MTPRLRIAASCLRLEVRRSGEFPAAGWGGRGHCQELGTRDGAGVLHEVMGPPSRPLAASFGVM